jgi:DNA polymerase III epsilon subunit-like protein
MAMKKTWLVAIDTETGGLLPGYHALLQLAAVPSWDAEPFNVWIWPDGHEIDPESVPVSGYSVEAWREKGAVSLAQALERFWLWLDKAPVPPWKLTPLAHNAGFDRGFLDAAFRFIGRRSPLGHRWRCSQASMGYLIDAGELEAGSTSLNALADLCGFARDDEAPHDALEDARLCMAGYAYLMGLPDSRRRAAIEAATTPSLN